VYYNYHAQARRLIEEGHLVEYRLLEEYHGIRPCLLLIFDNHRPMPIRRHRWEEYFERLMEPGK
jgi:hypothetical protein